MAWIESLGGSSGGGGGGTPITPSNVSPVQLTTGQTYEAQGNGVAIGSLSNITPSNASPVSLTSGNIYKMGGAGYAINSYSAKTPSSTPSSVSSGSIYKMSNNGYVINSYSSITPSDEGQYFNSGMVKMSSSGYASKSQIPDLAAPDVTSQANMSANASRNITVSQKPRYIINNVYRLSDNGYGQTWIYDSAWDNYYLFQYASSGYAESQGDGLPASITSVTSSNVTIKNGFGATVRSSVAIYY